MPKKIIIADDEEVVRTLIRVSLQEDGYQLFEARDGNEALQMAQAIKPDLIIMDVIMPGKTGYQVCADLKKDPRTKNICIFFLTARDSMLSQETIRLSGGDDVMIKPFNPADLREKIRLKLAGRPGHEDD